MVVKCHPSLLKIEEVPVNPFIFDRTLIVVNFIFTMPYFFSLTPEGAIYIFEHVLMMRGLIPYFSCRGNSFNLKQLSFAMLKIHVVGIRCPFILILAPHLLFER